MSLLFRSFSRPHLLPAVLGLGLLGSLGHAAETKPLRALLIAGGCCHDYAKQQEILSKGIQSRAQVRVDVVWSDDRSTRPVFPLYEKADWAAGYDVIIHDECSADVKDPALVQRILDAHKTVPAVHLHCAMHSYRTGTDVWFKHLGLQSSGHGPQEPIDIHFQDPTHPITERLIDWTTIREELYNNVKIMDAHVLATGSQKIKNKDGSTRTETAVVAWVNEKQGARSFSTTLGHNNETVADPRYLDFVTRGLLWACNRLDATHLTAYTGTNTVTALKGLPPAEKKETAPSAPAPKDALPVNVTVSSTQDGNERWKAVDRDPGTRWCADGGSVPQWIQLELPAARPLTGCRIRWESDNAYAHRVEGSPDGKTWTLLAEVAELTGKSPYEHAFKTDTSKFIRITCTASRPAQWVSIWEIDLKGPGISVLTPGPAHAKEAKQASADPYKKEGNIPPSITKLTPEEEAKILQDVKVPEDMQLSLFATPSAANYPVFVAAAPNGDLYVASDGNGSLGRNPHRGRIVRLRDTDRDGRADQVTEFVKDLDSPRGLVWDHDRLYVVHPPDISVFIDKNGDGVSDEQQVLVKGIAFGFKDRPADHTTNGLSLGIDGWLYIAGGDFGFMDAVGTDGKHLQHRGGGVVRFRPDGSKLEIFSWGTRNILEVSVGPLMNMFTRDNTNDGGGWDIRFHHFAGMEHHGYPTLFLNFPEEIVQPLAIYGGGSGCGATYLDEPGFGKWNDAPLTCDWGTGALWHHEVKPQGATYVETRKPEPLVRMTRPTDADVDALSNIYQASWKGATFDWAGPDVGYIVKVSPKGFTPAPLPDFAKAADAELVKLLESPSHRTRMEAQRALLRRPDNAATRAQLLALAGDKAKALSHRVAALYAVTQRGFAGQADAGAAALAADAALQPFVVRALSDTGFQVLADMKPAAPADVFATALKSPDARTRSEAVQGAVRQNMLSLAPHIAEVLADPDPIVAHVAFRGLGFLNAHAACFAVVDNASASSAQRAGALRALQRMHLPVVVDGLITRLDRATGLDARKGLLSALCRLHHTDGVWKGDSWGTRPDTRGPYYQPEAWPETPKIVEALKSALGKAGPEEASFLVAEMNRNRIKSGEALERILALAAKDAALLPDAVAQMAALDSVPAAGIPLLIQAARNPQSKPATLAQVVAALVKLDHAEGALACLDALATLSASNANKERETARNAFTGAPKLENHHQAYEAEVEKVGTPSAFWAEVALLNLSERKGGSPEAREMSRKSLDKGWENPARRVQILNAVREIKHAPYADRVLAALDDANPDVAKAAKAAAATMKLEKKTGPAAPLIATLKAEDVLAEVIKTKGDVALGEQLFTRQTCVACHTVSQDQPPKGPYLGNIAQTYKRPDLALSILDPNKSIAQGFASEAVTLKDGTAQMGFITFESADTIKLRNVTSQEFTYAVKDIKERQKLPMSIMPPGLASNLTVREFASLLDYLESLAKP